MVSIYVFDITGAKIATVRDRTRWQAFRAVVTLLRLSWKTGYYERAFSTNKHQECIHKSYYISYDKNFVVDLSCNNHNPLRPDRIYLPTKFTTDFDRGSLLLDTRTDEYGIQKPIAVHPIKTRMWHKIFLKKNQCLNPYYEN